MCDDLAYLLQFVIFCFSFTNIVITFEFHIEIYEKFQKKLLCREPGLKLTNYNPKQTI